MVIEVLIAVLVIELQIYLLSRFHRGFSNILKKHNITPYPFTIVVDVGRSFKVGIPGLKGHNVIRKVIGVVSIVNTAALMALFYWIAVPSIVNTLKIAIGAGRVESPFVPVIPGVTIRGINIIYFLIAVAISIAIHELSHAITALGNGIKVESWGLGLFIVFPFAFVRINEDEFSKSSLMTKAKVLSAGVLSNTVLALIVLGLMNVCTGVLSQYSTVVIYGLDPNAGPNAPAVIAGLPTPSIIHDINGTLISSVSGLLNYLSSTVNKSVTLMINLSRIDSLTEEAIVNGIHPPQVFNVFKPSNWSRLGIIVVEAYLPSTPRPLYHAVRTLFWVYVVNMSLALFNAAPLMITDGGRFLTEVLERCGWRKVNLIIQWFTIAVTAILLFIGLAMFT